MTFSMVARDAGTGAFGSIICSSSPAVAARCVHLADGCGAVHSQNVTDPRLGMQLLDGLARGHGASRALADLRATAAHLEWRQLLVVDTQGATAVHSGAEALGLVGEQTGPGVAAAGNMLADRTIPSIMVDTWLAGDQRQIESRLLACLEAAVSAGGEAGPVHSVGLSVISGHGWRVTDLRVDWSDDPVGDLHQLLQVWLPQREDYIQRALDPAASVGYGVSGDSR